VKSCTRYVKQKRGRRWWTPECGQVKAVLRQATELAYIRTEMRPLAAKTRTIYRRTLRDAKKKYEELQETLLLQRTERKPYLWLRNVPHARSACPVESGRLYGHFRSILSTHDTIPRTVPTVMSVWSEEDLQWRAEMQEYFTVQEVAEAIRRLPKKKGSGTRRYL
jgi:hypothetical protein